MNYDVVRHLHLIERACKRTGVDIDMVSDLGLEVIEKCLVSHAGKNSASFETYATSFLYQEFKKFKCKERQKKLMSELTNDEKKNLGQVIGQKPIFEPIDNRETFTEADLIRLRSKLTIDEYILLYRRFVEGETFEAIGLSFGVGRQTVHERLKRLLEKIKC